MWQRLQDVPLDGNPICDEDGNYEVSFKNFLHIFFGFVSITENIEYYNLSGLFLFERLDFNRIYFINIKKKNAFCLQKHTILICYSLFRGKACKLQNRKDR